MSNPKNSKFKDQKQLQNQPQLNQLDNSNQIGQKNSSLDELVRKKKFTHKLILFFF